MARSPVLPGRLDLDLVGENRSALATHLVKRDPLAVEVSSRTTQEKPVLGDLDLERSEVCSVTPLTVGGDSVDHFLREGQIVPGSIRPPRLSRSEKAKVGGRPQRVCRDANRLGLYGREQERDSVARYQPKRMSDSVPNVSSVVPRSHTVRA